MQSLHRKTRLPNLVIDAVDEAVADAVTDVVADAVADAVGSCASDALPVPSPQTAFQRTIWAKDAQASQHGAFPSRLSACDGQAGDRRPFPSRDCRLFPSRDREGAVSEPKPTFLKTELGSRSVLRGARVGCHSRVAVAAARKRVSWARVIPSAVLSAILLAVGPLGCRLPERRAYPPRPNIAPQRTDDMTETRDIASEPSLQLDPSSVTPMYTELLTIDLPTVVRVARAQNLDIQRARYAVEAAQGAFEGALGDAFPAIVPTALFERHDGRFVNTDGRIFNVGIANFTSSVAIDWIVNPGQVVYDILAARKRLYASEYVEESVQIESLRQAAVGYYALILAQAQIDAARQGVQEAEELFRIQRVRSSAGTGVRADELRTRARLAEREQDLVSALQRFYRASVELAKTLHLDAGVTLVPKAESLPFRTLVREDLGIDELLAIAVTFRPDLQGVREMTEAVVAERKRTWWSGFGPEFAVGVEYGGVTGHANNVKPGSGLPSNLLVNPASPTGAISPDPVANGFVREALSRGSGVLAERDDQTFTFSDFTAAHAAVGWRLSLATFGHLKKAAAAEAAALLDAVRKLDEVRAEVINVSQAQIAGKRLAVLSLEQLESAREALRLTQANLQAGTMTTLDVLQAQDAATQARYRYAQAVVGYNQSQVNLLAVLGLLSEETLGIDALADASADDQKAAPPAARAHEPVKPS